MHDGSFQSEAASGGHGKFFLGLVQERAFPGIIVDSPSFPENKGSCPELNSDIMSVGASGSMLSKPAPPPVWGDSGQVPPDFPARLFRYLERSGSGQKGLNRSRRSRQILIWTVLGLPPHPSLAHACAAVVDGGVRRRSGSTPPLLNPRHSTGTAWPATSISVDSASVVEASAIP